MRWRTGRKVHLTVYENDKLMFMCHTPEDAARVVKLLNQFHESGPPSRVLTDAELKKLRSVPLGDLDDIQKELVALRETYSKTWDEMIRLQKLCHGEWRRTDIPPDT